MESERVQYSLIHGRHGEATDNDSLAYNDLATDRAQSLQVAALYCYDTCVQFIV